ncbi:hypothetical protein QKC54_gp0504 [Megavirus baoshan]|uniref:Ankyrin repeat protein n=1 Tax=Megavirus baoshan TaxID=2496520 RepID=A0A3Q8U7T3_9VIRU|nr:hypothetical protein QKC54_gp0504 [Megavirus baoshan]AZL89325.1 hypothetical protein Mb0568 [Megavirus baoshan]
MNIWNKIRGYDQISNINNNFNDDDFNKFIKLCKQDFNKSNYKTHFKDFDQKQISKIIDNHPKIIKSKSNIKIIKALLLLQPNIIFKLSKSDFINIFPCIKNYIDGNVCNSLGNTFIYYFVDDIRNIIKILQSDIDLNINNINNTGETFVHYMFLKWYVPPKKKYIMSLINALISRNYNFDFVDRKGFNFLTLLFKLGNTKKNNTPYYLEIKKCILDTNIKPFMSTHWIKFIIDLCNNSESNRIYNIIWFELLMDDIICKNNESTLLDLVTNNNNVLNQDDIIQILSLSSNICPKYFENMMIWSYNDGNTFMHIIAKLQYDKVINYVIDKYNFISKPNAIGQYPCDIYRTRKISNLLN